MIVLSDPRQTAIEQAAYNWGMYRGNQLRQQQEREELQNAMKVIEDQQTLRTTPKQTEYQIATKEQLGTDATNGLNVIDQIIANKRLFNTATPKEQEQIKTRTNALRGLLPQNLLAGIGADDSLDSAIAVRDRFKQNDNQSPLTTDGQLNIPPSLSFNAPDYSTMPTSLTTPTTTKSLLPDGILQNDPVTNPYYVSPKEIKANPAIAGIAQQQAQQRARQEFDPDTFRMNVVKAIAAAGINPNAYLPYIDKQVKNIATNYVLDDIKRAQDTGGDMRNAALNSTKLLGDTKLVGQFVPQTSVTMVNEGDKTKAIQSTKNPFGNDVKLSEIGSYAINLTPGQKVQAEQFEKNLAQRKEEHAVAEARARDTINKTAAAQERAELNSQLKSLVEYRNGLTKQYELLVNQMKLADEADLANLKDKAGSVLKQMDDASNEINLFSSTVDMPKEIRKAMNDKGIPLSKWVEMKKANIPETSIRQYFGLQ